ncbi:MAG: hypothetical protein M1838_001857 [Thelocarpon superellum]|nr:MAG: hypothetical protein M1838_001857 [Thelocarpon superellum]
MTTPALKIAIVGAGISGLSTYLFLQKLLPASTTHEILIFETYPAPTRKEREAKHEEAERRDAASFIGGGLGVAPNGMHTLRELDPELHDAVVAQGYPVLRFQMKNSRNWSLGSMPTSDVSKEPPEVMVMSTRQGVWDCLRDRVPDDALRTGKTLVKVDRGPNIKPILHFADGSKTNEFDLVIGADGVKSIVKNAIRDGDHQKPIYEGLCGIGGFVPSSYLPPIPPNHKLPAPHSPVVMTFGAEGFFGYGPCEADIRATSPHLSTAEIKDNKAIPYGPRAMWWSTFSVEEPPALSKDIDKEAVYKQLRERHSKWQDPFIQKVLEDPSMFGMTATYVTPKLLTWTNDGVVLIGDAAHTLPSTSGQGVSQALEDAHTLGLLLAHYLQDDSLSASKMQQDDRTSHYAAQIAAATTAFQIIRKPRVEQILDFSRRMGSRKKKMGPVGEWTTYAMMWAMCALVSGLKPSVPGKFDVHAETRKVIRDEDRKRKRNTALAMMK